MRGSEDARKSARIDAATDSHIRAQRVMWLTTVRPDGRPHVVPIWFSWDGQTFLVFSKPHAVKVANIRARSQVMLAIGDPLADFDVQLIEASAELLDEPAATAMPPRHLGRYRDWLESIGLDRDEYVRTYSQAIRLVPTRFLPWRGRAPRRSGLSLLAAAA
jgi:PPOX class probable F420-dependent enzyme